MEHKPSIAAPGCGFTLIELSIVLVIIGLITGGILVGRDLISAAAVRAQLSQIEQFNTATNTFRGKYGYLPGDMPDPYATQFGFVSRAADTSGFLQGNGDGVINGIWGYGWNCCGETLVFWRDLSDAHLIRNGLVTAVPQSEYVSTPATVGLYLPSASVGGNNYIYVWNFNCPGCPWPEPTAYNYFSLSDITQLDGGGSQMIGGALGLTVSQAYALDTKMDDGMPLTGKVTAQYLNGGPQWAGSADSGHAVAGSSATCYDNAGAVSHPVQYSMGQNGASNLNCALSFVFQ